MEETLYKGLASWEEIKKTMENPPQDPKAKEAWEAMNDSVLNFILNLLM